MTAPEQYPIQTRKWRKRVYPEPTETLAPRAGVWLQCYSSLLARWCNIKWLGPAVKEKDEPNA